MCQRESQRVFPLFGWGVLGRRIKVRNVETLSCLTRQSIDIKNILGFLQWEYNEEKSRFLNSINFIIRWIGEFCLFSNNSDRYDFFALIYIEGIYHFLSDKQKVCSNRKQNAKPIMIYHCSQKVKLERWKHNSLPIGIWKRQNWYYTFWHCALKKIAKPMYSHI